MEEDTQIHSKHMATAQYSLLLGQCKFEICSNMDRTEVCCNKRNNSDTQMWKLQLVVE